MGDTDELVEAVLDQDCAKITALLQSKRFDINKRYEDGKTVLFMAAQKDYPQVVECLVDLGADIEISNDSGYTPFHISAETGSLQAAKVLLRYNAKTDVHDTVWGSTPLLCASFWGYTDIVRLLLSVNANPTECAVFDYSPLGVACLKGYREIALLLLQHGGSNLEQRNINGATPLLLAAGSGHIDLIDPLLEKGANVHATTNTGQGILHMLASSENTASILYLCKAKRVDYNLQDDEGATPLHLATSEQCIDNVKAFIRAGADVNIQDMTGNTALHVGGTKGYSDIVSYLLTVGADAKRTNNDGFKPVECAHAQGHSYLVQILKRVSTLDENIVVAKQQEERAKAESFTPRMVRSASAPIPAPRTRSRANSRTSTESENPAMLKQASKRHTYIAPIPISPGSQQVPPVARGMSEPAGGVSNYDNNFQNTSAGSIRSVESRTSLERDQRSHFSGASLQLVPEQPGAADVSWRNWREPVAASVGRVYSDIDPDTMCTDDQVPLPTKAKKASKFTLPMFFKKKSKAQAETQRPRSNTQEDPLRK